MQNKLSTGSLELDRWLHGGYDSDIITTLYGPAGSGKSNLCLIAAAYHASQGKKVIFIDTEGGFSVERLAQLASEDIMKNIFLMKVTNFAEQREAFNKLETLAKKDIGLIVVDSIVMLYRLERGEATQNNDPERAKALNRALARQMRILGEISRKHNIPILVTDQVYCKFLTKEEFEAGKEKQVEMVGGDILKYWSKCIIELQNIGQGKRKAVLKKHRALPEKEFVFVIHGKGIAPEKRFRLF
jgi:DNA repair protein RadB